MQNIKVNENNLEVEIQITDSKEVRLLRFNPSGKKRFYDDSKIPQWGKNEDYFKLVEIQLAGMNHCAHHGATYKATGLGAALRYVSHSDSRNQFGRKIEITQEYNQIFVKSHLQFFDGIAAVRSWTEIENKGSEEIVLEYISSFCLTGLESGDLTKRGENTTVYLPHNTWFGEAQWKSYSLNDLGYDPVNHMSVKKVGLSETGTWATCDYLPMGIYTNHDSDTTFAWQIETSGSWNWEISDKMFHMYVQLSGPSLEHNGFSKILKTGDSFESVPCGFVCVEGNFEKSLQEITKYRRAIRRQNKDNEFPAAIFNDYMNCLMGDPSTEKEIPLIDAAAEAGCKYYCIDCGWYDDGPWWDGVGEWLPAKKRFPNGIKEVLDYIRSKNMIPGLWLELEVMGIKCPMADKVSKDWFFQRNGKVLIDENHYQLDYRNPEVRAHATEVVRRLVEDYGVGYIKMDYNLDLGVGTDLYADSAADGMLGHKRAYLVWLDEILAKYPDLVFFFCSSGGMRMEYSMMSRCSIQSVTDQENYLKMAAIACNCASAVTPEQAAIWSYPLRNGDEEETAFNMVNALLFRIHQSGHLGELSKERISLVQEGIKVFNQICNDTKNGLPVWPLGFADWRKNILCTGISCGNKIYLAVWCTDFDQEVCIPLSKYGKFKKCKVIYPEKLKTIYSFNPEPGFLRVYLKGKTARLFELN